MEKPFTFSCGFCLVWLGFVLQTKRPQLVLVRFKADWILHRENSQNEEFVSNLKYILENPPTIIIKNTKSTSTSSSTSAMFFVSVPCSVPVSWRRKLSSSQGHEDAMVFKWRHSKSYIHVMKRQNRKYWNILKYIYSKPTDKYEISWVPFS